jgi:glycosyltransferase involved in cell wall biosynthesis
LITILTPHFPPISEFGGPNKSLAGVCSLLHKQKTPYRVIAKYMRHAHSDALKDFDNPNISFKDRIKIGELRQQFIASEVIWINTLYSYSFSVLPALALLFTPKRKVVLSPRGQLLKGALNTKKHLYLRLYTWCLKLAGHKYYVHYSNEQEARDSYAIFDDFQQVIFNNLVSGEVLSEQLSARDKEKFVLGYFGRISPIKNIEFLLELLKVLPDNVVLEVHGTQSEPRYIQRLKEQADLLDISSRLKFCDSYNKTTFAKHVQQVDLIVIPSISESFCHVFFEAIESRKLVLASTGLPWSAANKAVPRTLLDLDVSIWKERIEDLMDTDAKTYRQQQDKLVAYYMEVFETTKSDTLKGIKEFLN